MTLRIVQRNTYRFATRSQPNAVVQLRPRTQPHQRLAYFQITSRPLPLCESVELDDDGNARTHLSFESLERLVITATSEVDCGAPSASSLRARLTAFGAPWERARGSPDRYTAPSPRIDLLPLSRHRREAFVAGRSLGDALTALFRALHRDVAYERSTTIRTTASEALARGRGQCQDFAHLTIGALRAAGIGARYVGGYLLRGPLELHAWVSVHTASGWIDVDPTVRRLDADEHIAVAWGRDRSDVSPIEGLDDAQLQLELHLDAPVRDTAT
jgi:transglutaminase-like putative cysteine protease